MNQYHPLILVISPAPQPAEGVPFRPQVCASHQATQIEILAVYERNEWLMEYYTQVSGSIFSNSDSFLLNFQASNISIIVCMLQSSI